MFTYAIKFTPRGCSDEDAFTTREYKDGVTVTNVPGELCYRVKTFVTHGRKHSTGLYKVPACKAIVVGNGQHVADWTKKGMIVCSHRD